MKRTFWVWLHRWAGLAMAGFLVVVGLTGSLLAFLPELERVTAPALFPSIPNETGRFDAAQWASRTEALAPGLRVEGLTRLEGGPVSVWVSAGPEAAEPAFDQVMLDPESGQVLGTRRWGDLSQGLINLMPFVYKLHYALALDMPGTWMLGICALVWTLDCFVGLYLTLPARRRRIPAGESRAEGTRKSWLARWKPAWKVRWRAGPTKLNFDLHRAGGLWLWIALLIFAWSSVFMNLSRQVYVPVTRTVLDYPPRTWEAPDRAEPLDEPRLDWNAAQATGERLLAQAAQAQGFAVERPVGLWLDRAHGLYLYTARSSLDFQDKRGRTTVAFDADTGAFEALELPTGQHSGWTVTNWLQSLHEANVFGLPYRILVSALGLVIVMLSVTGIIIWLKKRRAGRLSRKPRRSNA